MKPMSSSDRLPVIVIGAGGHAAVVVSSLLRLDTQIVGATTLPEDKEIQDLGVPLIGGDEEIERMRPDEIILVNGIGMTRASHSARHNVARRMRMLGFRFRSVIDPTAVVAPNVEISEGVQVMAGAILQPRVVIGRDTIVNTGTRIDHDCHIGRDCHICPGVTLAGEVNIGDGSMVGSGAIATPGVSIQENSMIKAGSLITLGSSQ